MIAYCGLNCSTCDAYLATRNGGNARRLETAKNWSKLYGTKIEAEQINCDGCKSNGIRFFHCDACEILQVRVKMCAFPFVKRVSGDFTGPVLLVSGF